MVRNRPGLGLLLAVCWQPRVAPRLRRLFVSVDPKAKARAVHHHAYDRDKGIRRCECSLADFAKTPFWNKAAGDR